MYQRFYKHKYYPGKVETGLIDIKNNTVTMRTGLIAPPSAIYQDFLPIDLNTYKAIVAENQRAARSVLSPSKTDFER